MKGYHVFSGTVEKDKGHELLLDVTSPEANTLVTSRKATYICSEKERVVVTVPVNINDYENFKKSCRDKIKVIKMGRKSGSVKSNYRLGSDTIPISAKSSIVKNFLEDSKLRDFFCLIKDKTKPTLKADNMVSEQTVKAFFNREKAEVFHDLKKIKMERFESDNEWRKVLSSNKASICAIMPTYNEVNFKENIMLANKVRKEKLISEIIVTDGYSERHDPTDIKNSLKEAGEDIDYTVIRQNGSGKGDAIESAVKYALVKGHDFCIIVDSDNMPALSRVFPDAPVDINIEFFLRSFIREMVNVIKTNGLDNAKKTFFKASYMRMPQLKKSFELRFGLVTKIIKDFYHRSSGSTHNLYPLSGEVAFSPVFLLEKLSLNTGILDLLGLGKKQHSGSNVPSGFCLETFWNTTIDVMNYNIHYINTLLHHHGPVVKSTKTDIGEQIGEVLTGTFAGYLISLISKGEKDKRIFSLLEKIPLEVMRSDRLSIVLDGDTVSEKNLA